MAHKLLVETPDLQSFQYVVEEQNLKTGTEKKLYIEGPYMMAGDVNRNKRVYDLQEMVNEVKRYSDTMITSKRALGELNHPTSAEVDLERACHMVTEMRQDDNVFYGKSRVLTSTPMGKIVEGLIQDGVQVGVSSRALGKLMPMEGKKDVNLVKEMRLIAVDCVADPSFPKAFVNGILESKQFVCQMDGSVEEMYEQLENALDHLPRHDVDSYLREQALDFIKKLQYNL